MRAIMISIQPQWVEKILNGEKTIEIRTTMPKCKLPCKVYIYQTKKNFIYKILKWLGLCKGKVVAEFMLNKVDEFHIPCEAKYLYDALNSKNQNILKQSCLDIEEILKYLKDKYNGYAWHIDNLKIYDKPKELSVFKKQNACYVAGGWEELGCWECCCTFQELGDCDGRCSKLERPPQSWCYVEELEVVDK